MIHLKGDVNTFGRRKPPASLHSTVVRVQKGWAGVPKRDCHQEERLRLPVLLVYPQGAARVVDHVGKNLGVGRPGYTSTTTLNPRGTFSRETPSSGPAIPKVPWPQG